MTVKKEDGGTNDLQESEKPRIGMARIWTKNLPLLP